MANGRNKGRRGSPEHDGGPFVLLPWSVLDCPAYEHLSHPARSLLIEMARQFVRDNNGRLLASRAYLAKRGWRSAAVIDRAKHELIDAGFIYETVKGHRPNKASWYAMTWWQLHRHPGYDAGAVEGYQRSAYRQHCPLKNEGLNPRRGTGTALVGPPRGTGSVAPVPSHGTIGTDFRAAPVPSGGHHLDMPSTGAAKQQVELLSAPWTPSPKKSSTM